MVVAVVLFWLALGALVWTHVGYPLSAGLLARVAPRRRRTTDDTPSVTVIVAAHDENVPRSEEQAEVSELSESVG